ncbi:MAG: prepilin-type N-terminal cleavage/methylation domain-containing protein [Syntrophothermus sp.]|nr:prepilin-type N-terminal cleavage/methylation domain-containing protein [Syntrophothermus sp.]
MRDSLGFTLIEALVALTIMAIVVTAASLLYVSGYRQYARENDRIEVQENLRIAMARMAAKIRQAKPDSVNITDAGSHIEFTLSFSGESTGYRLDALDKEIEEKFQGKDGTAWLPIASNITGLLFKYDAAAGMVAVTVTGERGKSGSVSLTTEVHLRVGENG